jgi:serine/threonine-protein phosphatase 2A regulatory subunit A
MLGFANLVDSAVVLRDILPCVKELVTDGSQHVRAAIALQISGLSPVLGKEKYTFFRHETNSHQHD